MFTSIDISRECESGCMFYLRRSTQTLRIWIGSFGIQSVRFGEETCIPNLWLLYQVQDQKNAPSVTVPLHSGEGGICTRFGGFRKIADIPGLLCSGLAKEGSKLFVEM